MPEIIETLKFDIDQALRQIDQIEQSLDRALAPVEIRVEADSTRGLEESLERVERLASDINLETQSLALNAGRSEANFEELARALDISEDEARRLTAEILDAQAAANRLENAARDVAQQLDLSEDEAAALTRELRQADRAAESIDTSTSRLATGFAGIRGAAAGIGAALAAIGGTQILGAAIRGAQAAIGQFQALNESINAVEITFTDASEQIFAFGEVSAQAAGLSAQAFQQAVVPIGSVLTNFGFNARNAADASVELVQRAADLASVFNSDVSEALLAINSALVGQVEPLRRYGAEVSAARVEQFALAAGIIQTGEELDQAAEVQARVGLILADTARVQGDFADTSGELANATRIAAAETEEFAAEVGEQLAPAMERLVAILPDVLEGVRQLVPEFAAGADSAAAFFESIGEGGGLRTEFATIRAGFNLVTSGAGLATEASLALSNVFTGNFPGAVDAVQRGGILIERAFTRGIGVALANALDKGTDSVEAFNEAVIQTARSSQSLDVFTENFRAFAIQAGLSEDELREVTAALIENADQAGLTGQEVDFLRTQLALLAQPGQEAAFAIRDIATATGEIGSAVGPAAEGITGFADVVQAEADRLATFSGQLQTASAGIAEALDPFAQASENIETSAQEFFENLVAQVEQQAEFQANIATLIAAGFDDVALEIFKAGPGANRAAEQFLSDLDLAGRAERLLEGQGTKIALDIGSELAVTLSSADLTAQQEQAFIDLMEQGIFSNSQVQQAIAAGAIGTAEELGAQIEAAFGGVVPNLGLDEPFREAGVDARTAFFLGINDAQPGEVGELRESITNTLDGAIRRFSPPQLFVDAGLESGEAFWAGFEQADLTMRLPVPSITGSVDTGIGAGVSGGSTFNFSPTINQPVVTDLDTTLAQQEQLFGAVAGILNGRFTL